MRGLHAADAAPLAALVALNFPAIQLARSATDRPGVDWGESNDPRTAVLGHFEIVQTPLLATLSCILNDAAVLDHYDHDDAAAVEDLLACLRLADAAAMGPPILNTHQTASSIAAVAARTLSTIIPQLSLRSAARGRLRLLLDRLCDESALRRCGVDAVYGHACWALDRIAAGRSTVGLSRLIRPMYLLDAERLLELDDAAAAAMANSSLASASPDTNDTRTASVLYRSTHAFSLATKPLLRAALEMHFDALGQRRSASIALAAKLFEFDHGKQPVNIAELVPRYLPAVPIDAQTGRPMPLGPTGRSQMHLPPPGIPGKDRGEHDFRT